MRKKLKPKKSPHRTKRPPAKPQKKNGPRAPRAKKSAKPAVKATPRKVGRPTDYRPEMCAKVRALGKEGKSRAQIARALDVGYTTIETWCGKHPEFATAMRDAYFLAMAHWEDVGAGGLRLGVRFNATAFVFLMKNRFPREYRDRQEHQVTEIVSPPIPEPPDLSHITEPKEMLKAFEAFRVKTDFAIH